MSLLHESDPRFARLGLKLGLFAGLALALGLVMLLGLAWRQGYFAAKSPVSFEAASGQDLRTGMAVKLSGFKIGEVSQVALNEAARVDVVMQIEDRYRRWIKADSVATLAREGMIGDSYISVSAGSPALPPLLAEQKISYELGRGLADIAMDVRNRVVPVIDEMQLLLRYGNDPQGDLRQGIGEFRRLTAELRQTRQKLDGTIAQLQELQKTELATTLQGARQTLAQADTTLQRLDTALPPLLGQAQASLQHLDTAAQSAQQVTQQAGQLLQGASPRLNLLLDDGRGLVNESRAAVAAARGRWPFSGRADALAPVLPPAPPALSTNP